MKRIMTILLSLCLLLLCGCSGNEKTPAMYIEPAQLTQAETDIMKLLDMDVQQQIFDFKVDETVRRIELNAYELIDGKWDPFFGGGGRAFTDTEGRMALRFENIGEGLWESLQSENHSGHTGWESLAEDEPETGISRASTMLTNRQEIIYEEEIPLAVQIITSRNMIRAFDTTYFFHPEEYAQYGYDHVYAVTVRFSQEPLN